MKRYLCAWVGLLALAACNPQARQPAATEAPAITGQPAASPPPAGSSPGTSYEVYRGLLPGQADSSTLHLVTSPQPLYDERGPSSHGNYYGPDGHPYEVQGQLNTPDSLLLRDLAPEHQVGTTGEAPVWRLRRQPGGGLAGTVGGQAVQLRLVPAPVGGLTFAVRYLADSLAAGGRLPVGSAKARIYLQALEVVGGAAAVRQQVQASIRRELRGDTLATELALALPALFGQRRDSFYREYREAVADLVLPADTTDAEAYQPSLNFTDQLSTYVCYQQGNLLSLGFLNYSYTGGAHGAIGTTVASYDLRTGRRLRYADIFRPGVAPRLAALLAPAVRQVLGLRPGQPLDGLLSVSAMPVTRNVFLTGGGVVFSYQPYEIASYVLGEIRVFVPLAQLRPLLRTGLPLPLEAGVAAR